jgi:hypothetical protein
MRLVTVELELSQLSDDYFFVVIRGLPYTRGLVITHACKRDKAERIKAAVEEALDAFRRQTQDEPSGGTRFDRIE